jgi:excinuclease ABC subunit B
MKTREGPHKPHLDEMGIALHHERQVYRAGRTDKKRPAPRKPTLDEMGPGPESAPYRGPRSSRGRPGTRTFRGKR